MVNAIYFKGIWRRPFPKENTRMRKFNLLNNQQVDTKFMEQTATFYFVDSPEFKAKLLRIPYKGRKFAMILVLPNEDSSLEQVVKDLNSRVLNHAIQLMSEYEVNVKIPKLKFDYSANLNTPLQEVNAYLEYQIVYTDLNPSIAFFTAWNPWDLHTRCISPIAVTRPSRKRAFTCLQYRSKGRTHSGRRRQHSLCRHRNWIGEQIRRRHHQRLHCRQTLPILHWGWECWHGFVRWQGHQSRPITISRFISWSLRWVEKRECKTEGIYNLCKFPNFAYREEEEQLNWSQSHEDPVFRLNAFQYLG